MFVGVSNEGNVQSQLTAGNGLQFIIYCALKKKYVSSIGKKGRRGFVKDITKAKVFTSREFAEKKMQYFQKILTIAKTEKGIILV